MAVLSWEIWFVIGLSLAFGGLVKGLTGLGLPVFTIPVIAVFIGVERSVVMLLVPSLVLNCCLAWTHRDFAKDMPELPRLLLMGLLGVGIGANILYHASEKVLATLLSAGVLAYLLVRVIHPAFTLSPKSRKRWAPLVGFTAGSLQASTGISAPVVVPYVDSLGLSSRSYVFAVAAIFSGFSVAHFAILLFLQAYTPEQLVQSAAAAIPALVFMPLGIWLRKYVSPRLFGNLVRVLLLIMAVKLLQGAWLA